MTDVAGRILTVGGGGHAKVVLGLLRRLPFEIVGYTDGVDQGQILGVPWIGTDSKLPDLLVNSEVRQAALGVGKVDASHSRQLLGREIAAMGFHFPVVVSPAAIVNQEVVLGAGSVVCDGAVVNVGTSVGDFCIVNSNSVVEHDCRLGDNVHIAPGALLSGTAEVGDDCMIGVGATVLHRVRICGGTLIGAGSLVLRDITSPGVYAGNPLRRLQ